MSRSACIAAGAAGSRAFSGVRARPGARLVLTALLAAAPVAGSWPPAASAQSIFTCKDARGHTLTSDRPIPECAQRPMRELAANGALKREIAAPLTPEQLQQKALENEQRLAAENKRRQLESRDKALLIAFANVAALERARQRQIDDSNDDITAAQKRMIALHKELIETQAAALGTKGRPVSEGLKRRTVQIAQAILDDDAVIAKRRAEQVELNERFDEDARRLRFLLHDEQPIVQAAGQPPAAR